MLCVALHVLGLGWATMLAAVLQARAQAKRRSCQRAMHCSPLACLQLVESRVCAALASAWLPAIERSQALQDESAPPWDPGVLPPGVVELQDPQKPVRLPPPDPMFRRLDNKPVDKLVQAISATPGMWPRLTALTRWLSASGFAYDARTCTTLIFAFSANAQHDRARRVYDWMRRELRLKPTVHTYTAVMKSALEAGQVDAAMQVWEDAKRAGTSRDIKLTCTYMSVLVRAGRSRQVLQLYDRMAVAAPQGGVPQQARVLAMRAYTQTRRPEDALAVFQKVLAQEGDSGVSGASHLTRTEGFVGAHACLLARLAAMRHTKWPHHAGTSLRRVWSTCRALIRRCHNGACRTAR